MPSPFPGMDPYLEHPHRWPSVHLRMITNIADALTVQVRPEYYVLLEENVYLHELADDSYRLFGRADGAVAIGGGAHQAGSPTATLEAPVTGRVPYAVEEERVPYATIVDRESREIVTVIELLSPTNKRPGADREQYLAKRRQLFRSNVHFVEIDLLRGQPRLPVENLPACDYVALVSRWEDRPNVQLWPVRLRERLPVVPVPLKPRDAAAHLDLQDIVNHVYDAGGYEDFIYRNPPDPPLSQADAQWAEHLLQALRKE